MTFCLGYGCDDDVSFYYFADETVSFQKLAAISALYKILMSFATFLVTLGLLHILRYNRTIAILAATINDSKWRMGALGLFCLAFLVAFAGLTHCWFGAQMYDFRAMFPAMMRLAIRHMDLDYENTRQAAGIFGCLVVLVFCFTTLIILMNFMITLLNDALENLATQDGYSLRNETDDEVIQYMLSLLKLRKKPDEGQ